MKRFKSPRQVQRFLFTHDQIANVFARRPNRDTATKFHSIPNQAFTTWAEVTGVAMAAHRCSPDPLRLSLSRIRQLDDARVGKVGLSYLAQLSKC
jgi:hypothetical protein